MNDKLVKYCALLSIIILLFSGCRTENNASPDGPDGLHLIQAHCNLRL